MKKRGWMLKRVERVKKDRWTIIATRPRDVFDSLWVEAPKAPIDSIEARQCADAGLLIMASRHLVDRVECVVRPSHKALESEMMQTPRPLR